MLVNEIFKLLCCNFHLHLLLRLEWESSLQICWTQQLRLPNLV